MEAFREGIAVVETLESGQSNKITALAELGCSGISSMSSVHLGIHLLLDSLNLGNGREVDT